MWCSWLSSQALNLQTRVRCPAWTPAFVAQLAEHRTLNAKVAGSYPVDSLQSAMPQRSGARLRIECNSQAGSTPVVDNLRVGTVDVMPIRNRLPLSGCRFDSCCSRTPSLVMQWISTFLSHGKDSSSILLEATNLGLETAVVRPIRNRLPLYGCRFDSCWSRRQAS